MRVFNLEIIKKVTIILFIPVFIFCVYEFLRRRVGSFAGAYPFMEPWKVDHKVQDRLSSLHKLNPNLFKDKVKLNLENDYTGHWKKVSFYYSDRDELVQVLIRDWGSYTTVSLLYFIAVHDGKMRVMNKDFDFFENQREKKIFENRILKLL